MCASRLIFFFNNRWIFSRLTSHAAAAPSNVINSRGASFDHLVGDGEQSWRHFNAERELDPKSVGEVGRSLSCQPLSRSRELSSLAADRASLRVLNDLTS